MDERGRKARQVRTQQPHRTADALPAPGATPHADVAPREAGAAEAWLNPRDPRTEALLKKRTASGGYEVGEADLVRNIRHLQEGGELDSARKLCEVLVDRCMPEFQRRTYGLRHRPELREDAIEAMIEQVLIEARNPNEVFMTKNFVHYLRCLCADQFNRVLRQEGLSYRRDEQGKPAGRGHHVPRALVESLDTVPAERDDELPGREIADSRDSLGERIGILQAEQILLNLPDPLDRQIMVLRVLEGLQWEEIAQICGKTERTMRLRFEKARTVLAAQLTAEPE
jgi:DNA-directed RNA polymerase specialized sigma24 family protein